jgi:hypothetical protein
MVRLGSPDWPTPVTEYQLALINWEGVVTYGKRLYLLGLGMLRVVGRDWVVWLPSWTCVFIAELSQIWMLFQD